MNSTRWIAAAAAMTLTAATLGAQAPAAPPPGGQQRTASVNTQPRVEVRDMPRPIDMHDSVWIENLTMLEVRDLIKGGKTTALIFTGGIEENGPVPDDGQAQQRAQGDGRVDRAFAWQRAGRADRHPRARQSRAVRTCRPAPSCCRRRPIAPCSPTSRPASSRRASPTSSSWATAAAT